MKEESFYEWLMLFKDFDRAIGDLARCVSEDEYFPKANNDRKTLMKYFAKVSIDSQFIGTANNAVYMYENRLI